MVRVQVALSQPVRLTNLPKHGVEDERIERQRALQNIILEQWERSWYPQNTLPPEDASPQSRTQDHPAPSAYPVYTAAPGATTSNAIGTATQSIIRPDRPFPLPVAMEARSCDHCFANFLTCIWVAKIRPMGDEYLSESTTRPCRACRKLDGCFINGMKAGDIPWPENWREHLPAREKIAYFSSAPTKPNPRSYTLALSPSTSEGNDPVCRASAFAHLTAGEMSQGPSQELKSAAHAVAPMDPIPIPFPAAMQPGPLIENIVADTTPAVITSVGSLLETIRLINTEQLHQNALMKRLIDELPVLDEVLNTSEPEES